VVRKLIPKLCNAVAYCHRNGVAHRDLKPSNSLMNKDGTALKIADFGSAVRVKESGMELLINNKYEYRTLLYTALELLMGDTSYNCFAVEV